MLEVTPLGIKGKVLRNEGFCCSVDVGGNDKQVDWQVNARVSLPKFRDSEPCVNTKYYPVSKGSTGTKKGCGISLIHHVLSHLHYEGLGAIWH